MRDCLNEQVLESLVGVPEIEGINFQRAGGAEIAIEIEPYVLFYGTFTGK